MAGTRIAALALAVGLVMAGCGEDDDEADEFRDGYNAAVERLNEVNSNIEESGEELASKPGGQIAREFDRIAKTADRTRANLAELEPPEEAQDEFDRLLAAIEDGVGDIRAVADAARQENPERFQEATEQLSESGQEISQAENEFKDAVGGG
jgi:methyl-accepting chemotaxis protein